MRRHLRDAIENRITPPHPAVVVAALTFKLMSQRPERVNLPHRPAGWPDYFP